MPVSQFGHEQDWVEASVLSQCVRDELEGLAVGLAHIRVVAKNGTGVLLKLVSNFHFNTGATWHQGSLLDEGTDDAESIMEGAVGFVEDELVRASKKNGDGLALVRALSDLDNLGGTTCADLFDEASGTELLSLELVDMGDGSGTNSLADEINLVTINILDDHDLLLGEEVEGQVADGLSEDALLEEEHVGAGGDDLFDNSENVLAFLLNDSVHSLIVADDNVGLHVTLGCTDGELNQSNLSVLNSRGATSQVRCLLVNEAETVDEGGLVDGTAELLAHVDVLEVDVVSGGWIDDLQDGIDGHRGE